MLAVGAPGQTPDQADTGVTSGVYRPNRLSQDFSATHPNEKWVTGATYIPTHKSWLYRLSVRNLYSRQGVGWAMSERHDAILATSALDMAVHRQRSVPGLIVHSDRGSEFANAASTSGQQRPTSC